jgi:hypothetical protein
MKKMPAPRPYVASRLGSSPKDRFVLTEQGLELRRLFVRIFVEWKQITSVRVVSEPGIERFFGLAPRPELVI